MGYDAEHHEAENKFCGCAEKERGGGESESGGFENQKVSQV